jgi:hypothetical protein
VRIGRRAAKANSSNAAPIALDSPATSARRPSTPRQDRSAG